MAPDRRYMELNKFSTGFSFAASFRAYISIAGANQILLNLGFYKRVNHRSQSSMPDSICSVTETSIGSQSALVFAALTLLISCFAIVRKLRNSTSVPRTELLFPWPVVPPTRRDAVLQNIATIPCWSEKRALGSPNRTDGLSL